MEVKTLENKKEKMIFELVGGDNTLANMLVEELWNDKSIKAAGYSVDHPLKGVPKIVVETDGKETASDAVKKAIDRLKKIIKDTEKELLSAL